MEKVTVEYEPKTEKLDALQEFAKRLAENEKKEEQ